MPRRDDRFDYTKPVDGSDPATDWGALHALAELPNVDQPAERLGAEHQQLALLAPPAPYSPKPARFPKYMDMFGENYRGLHALQLLTGSSGWTLERLQAAAFDSYQPGFADADPAADPGL